jgi:hypothetical protein
MARSLKSTALGQAHGIYTSQLLADSRGVLVPLGYVALDSPVSWSTRASGPAYRVFSIYIQLACRIKCDDNSPSTSFPISNAYKESPNAV